MTKPNQPDPENLKVSSEIEKQWTPEPQKSLVESYVEDKSKPKLRVEGAALAEEKPKKLTPGEAEAEAGNIMAGGEGKALTPTDYLRAATNILAAYNNEVSNVPNNSSYWSAMNAYRASKRGDI